MLVTFEGIDGAGKTTLMKQVSALLKSNGNFGVFEFREPGGTILGEEIRKLLKTYSMQPSTAFLLFSAARKENTELVKSFISISNEIDEQTIFLFDRYVDSSYAYQCVYGVPLHLIAAVSEEVALKPDLSFFLDIDVETAIQRLKAQGDKEDNQNVEFLSAVDSIYRERMKLEANRWFVLDATLPLEELAHIVVAEINRRHI